MAAADEFCLACRQVITANDRRYLCTESNEASSESASDVYKVWRDLLVEKLEDKNMEMDVESVFRAAGHTCTCRKCFNSFKRFYEKKSWLLSKLDAAIEKIPSTSRIISGLSESSADSHTPSRQLTSRKRCCPCPNPEQRSKFPRISGDWHPFAPGPSSSSTSPKVEVTINYCVWCDNVIRYQHLSSKY